MTNKHSNIFASSAVRGTVAAALIASAFSVSASTPAAAMSKFQCVGFMDDYWVNICDSDMRFWYVNQWGQVGLSTIGAGQRDRAYQLGHYPQILNVCFYEEYSSTRYECAV